MISSVLSIENFLVRLMITISLTFGWSYRLAQKIQPPILYVEKNITSNKKVIKTITVDMRFNDTTCEVEFNMFM